jgi:hypothetical protein
VTPSDRRACLDLLGWSQRGLARLIGFDERMVRHWFAGRYDPPEAIDAWLWRRAEAMRADPPPAGRKG